VIPGQEDTVDEMQIFEAGTLLTHCHVPPVTAEILVAATIAHITDCSAGTDNFMIF